MKHRITLVKLIAISLVCLLFLGCAGMALQKNIKALKDQDASLIQVLQREFGQETPESPARQRQQRRYQPVLHSVTSSIPVSAFRSIQEFHVGSTAGSLPSA